MADFTETNVNKSALRDLEVPIADVTSFNNLVQSVIDTNPFGCVDYTTKAGQTVAGVIRNRERYTAKVNFIDDVTSKRLGTVSLQSPSIAAFEANAAEVLANAALATAMGGVAERDSPHENYYTQLKCHDPSGDDYYVTFTRRSVRISSYQDDAIVDTIETWADGVPALD